MKTSVLLVCAGLACAATPSAFAFAEIGRGELLLSTTARATYDSRVLGGLNPADDYIFTLHPEFQYVREAAVLKLRGTAGVHFNRYREFDQFDSEDADALISVTLPGDSGRKLHGSLTSSYREDTDVNYDVNTRIRTRSFLTRFDSTWMTGLKTNLKLDGSFRNDERNQFSDRETIEGSFAFNYLDFLRGTDLNLRYRHLDTETSGDNSIGTPLDQVLRTYSAGLSRPIYAQVRGTVTYGYRILTRSAAETAARETRDEGSLYSVSLEGPFLSVTRFPKLESSLALSYHEADTPGINDTGTKRFMGAAQLAWHARERTRLSFNARRALELSINDITVETTSFSARVNQEIGTFVTASAGAGFEHRDFRGVRRSDDVYTFDAGVEYRATKAFATRANYRYRSTESSVTFADYGRHVASISASYTF